VLLGGAARIDNPPRRPTFLFSGVVASLGITLESRHAFLNRYSGRVLLADQPRSPIRLKPSSTMRPFCIASNAVTSGEIRDNFPIARRCCCLIDRAAEGNRAS
jgi:hypothetical protein